MQRDGTTAEILEELRHRVPDPARLEPLLPVYEALLKLEEDTGVPPPPVTYHASEAHSTLQEGVPLLQRAESPFIPEPMIAVWQQVCELAARHLESQAVRLEEARGWPEGRPDAWLATMGEYFRNGQVSAEDEQERKWLTFVMVHTWRPFLRRWAAELRPLIEGAAWGRQRCPICGGQPDFATLAAETGERYLICARCDTEWRYQRLGCPFCCNWNASTYGYYPDEWGKYRLYVCNECQRYLKTLDLREAMGGQLLAVERIATFAMDIAALRAGYRSV